MSEPRPQTESELVDFVRSIDVPAPPALHDRVETLVSERPQGSRRRAWGSGSGRPAFAWALGGAVAVAVVVAALVVGLSGGGSPSLSLRATSALALGPATMGAPAENPHDGSQLAVAVDGLAFPYWGEHLGWRSTGVRTDRIGGHTVTTVFYADGRGRRVGYAIVGGTPAPGVSGGVVAWRGRTAYRLLSVNGVGLVAWTRDGHLCVVSGRGVDGATLLRLASWSDRAGLV